MCDKLSQKNQNRTNVTEQDQSIYRVIDQWNKAEVNGLTGISQYPRNSDIPLLRLEEATNRQCHDFGRMAGRMDNWNCRGCTGREPWLSCWWSFSSQTFEWAFAKRQSTSSGASRKLEISIEDTSRFSGTQTWPQSRMNTQKFKFRTIWKWTNDECCRFERWDVNRVFWCAPHFFFFPSQ